jgi:hypothetical protein
MMLLEERVSDQEEKVSEHDSSMATFAVKIEENSINISGHAIQGPML